MGIDNNLTLINSELRYRRLFEAAQDGILILDAGSGLIEDVNPYLIKMLGYTREEFIKKRIWDVGAFHDIEANKNAFEFLQDNEYIRYETLPLKTKAGRLVQVEFVSNVYLVDDEKVIQCNIRDITDRKSAEDALLKSENKYRILVEHLPLTIYTNAVGHSSSTVYVSPRIEFLLGFSAEEWMGDPNLWSKCLFPEDRQMVMAQAEDADRKGEPFEMEYRMIARDGRLVWVHDKIVLVDDLEGLHPYREGIMQDITERKLSEARIQRQFEHLNALRAIDQVIAGNFSLELSLSEILLHVTNELGVDAADILLYKAGLQVLEYGAEHGFYTKSIRNRRLHLGESYAGLAALERRLVQVPNLKDDPNNLFFTTHLKNENFVCYFSLPLIAKGQVKGVLEIFNRSAFEPDAEWFDFLDLLAGQAAIAIDNVMLFDSLQRSNWDLIAAYDATIEGWSHALDLRDKETEGHTLRVTELTLKLAKNFGLSDEDLLHVRWGALLHDIGKLGVPDGILLKPGPLTEEEWVAMRLHPTFAYEMLAPIHYLQSALEIPFCHHENWDGSGYPRGLKEEQIPLVARIFAVVDVWDALKSDRPYRPAWTDEKVREHILILSGTRFDPQVVDMFMKFI